MYLFTSFIALVRTFILRPLHNLWRGLNTTLYSTFIVPLQFILQDSSMARRNINTTRTRDSVYIFTYILLDISQLLCSRTLFLSNFKQLYKGLILLISSVFFCACTAYDSASHRMLRVLTPYRVAVVQGNFISREAVAQLKPGMTKEQVRFLLGTPLLHDIFHADRWDYIFTYKRGDSVIVHQRRYTVYFEGDHLVKFGGDELPSEYELIAEIDGIRKPKSTMDKDINKK